MTAARVFPAEIFVDQTLVMIRDSNRRICGSTVPLHEHARQAAALASAAGASNATIAAALLYGIGDALVASWSRHPSRSGPTDPVQATLGHLGLHFPETMTAPISLLADAHIYLRENQGLTPTPEGRAAERRLGHSPHASAAVELAIVDTKAGQGPMITPPLGDYRDLLHTLCNRTLYLV